MIDLSEKIWTTDDIQRGLRQLPSLIASKSMDVAKKEAEVKQMKHTIVLLRAGETIKHNGEKVTATLQKAYGDKASEIQNEQLIELEKDYELLKAELAEYRDWFDSIRKAANLMQEEMRQNAYGEIIKRR